MNLTCTILLIPKNSFPNHEWFLWIMRRMYLVLGSQKKFQEEFNFLKRIPRLFRNLGEIHKPCIYQNTKIELHLKFLE